MRVAAQEVGVEAQRLGARRLARARGAQPVEAGCAAAVRGVLAQEATDPQRMRVTYARLGSEGEAQAGLAQPLAQVAVLAGRGPEGGVEAADRLERRAPDKHVARRQEAGVRGVG